MKKILGNRFIEFLIVFFFFSLTTYFSYLMYYQSFGSSDTNKIFHFLVVVLGIVAPFYMAWMVAKMYRRKALHEHLKSKGISAITSNCSYERLDKVFMASGMPYYLVDYTFEDNGNVFNRRVKIPKGVVDKHGYQKELKSKKLTVIYDPEVSSWNLWKAELKWSHC